MRLVLGLGLLAPVVWGGVSTGCDVGDTVQAINPASSCGVACHDIQTPTNAEVIAWSGDMMVITWDSGVRSREVHPSDVMRADASKCSESPDGTPLDENDAGGFAGTGISTGMLVGVAVGGIILVIVIAFMMGGFKSRPDGGDSDYVVERGPNLGGSTKKVGDNVAHVRPEETGDDLEDGGRRHSHRNSHHRDHKPDDDEDGHHKHKHHHHHKHDDEDGEREHKHHHHHHGDGHHKHKSHSKNSESPQIPAGQLAREQALAEARDANKFDHNSDSRYDKRANAAMPPPAQRSSVGGTVKMGMPSLNAINMDATYGANQARDTGRPGSARRASDTGSQRGSNHHLVSPRPHHANSRPLSARKAYGGPQG